MDYRPEILEYLLTPGTWAIAGLIAFILFFYCVADAMIINKDDTRVFRVFELLGFIVYAGLFENIGVLGNTYNYSLDRVIVIGVVPLTILMLEAAVFYSALRFAEVMKFPKWAIPFVVGVLAVLQDMTIDPVAVFDLHNVDGIMEGRWNWTSHYDKMFFGIPFFNYTGWFLLMFYYTVLIQIGRKLHEKSNYKNIVGLAYILVSPVLGVILIISPITRFLLFLNPIFPIYTNRTAEIFMLLFVVIISIAIMFKYRKRDTIDNIRDYPVIWLIPLILHAFDIILAFTLKIKIAYIPVLLFAGIHLGYLSYYYFKTPSLLKKNE